MINIIFWLFFFSFLYCLIVPLFFIFVLKKYNHFVKQGKRSFAGNPPFTGRTLDELDEVETIAFFYYIIYIFTLKIWFSLRNMIWIVSDLYNFFGFIFLIVCCVSVPLTFKLDLNMYTNIETENTRIFWKPTTSVWKKLEWIRRGINYHLWVILL